MTGPNLFAYVDETGDLGAPGSGGKTSPVFGMACVLVPEENQQDLRNAVHHLRDAFRIPSTSVFSWKDHVKTHDRRKYAASILGAVPGIRVTFVYTEKSAVVGRYVRERGLLYNYVAGKAYKSILWAARSMFGPNVSLHTRFGAVRGFDHDTTRAYFEKELQADSRVPTHLERGLRWVSATQYTESEAADIYGGFLRAATWPNEFGAVEGAYLEAIWHQVPPEPTRCRIPLGFMSMPSYSVARRLPWWFCRCSACTEDGESGTSGGRST